MGGGCWSRGNGCSVRAVTALRACFGFFLGRIQCNEATRGHQALMEISVRLQGRGKAALFGGLTVRSTWSAV